MSERGTRVRSYSKINLGLAIGAPRPDGFHALSTVYQTLALHDLVTVCASKAPETRLRLRSSDPRVPLDARNTVWKMVERALAASGVTAQVDVFIQKNLPIQGGMGAGSANAAAALIALERELGLELPETDRMHIAAAVGSDVPLFLLGGTVLGADRGQVVHPVRALTLGGRTELACVVALPRIGVSTPAAFREWDKRFTEPDLQKGPARDTIDELSRTYASILQSRGENSESGASGIFPEPSLAEPEQGSPENLQGFRGEQLHQSQPSAGMSGIEDDLAGNTLLALVRTGIENDFESVVFPQYPSLREIKRHLMGDPGSLNAAVYAALSGSGSALFGLYRSDQDAAAAQQRLRMHGVEAIVTNTISRPLYWSRMFAE